jgi:hypothetical protein
VRKIARGAAASLLLAALCLAAFGARAEARPWVSPPFYWLWGRGNCVWFAWVKAWQEWGAQLPWAGDAKNWTCLAGARLRDDAGRECRLVPLDAPEPGCLVVMQPEAFGNMEYPYASLGHVAWVAEAKELRVGWNDHPPEPTGWWELRLEESSVHPDLRFCEGELHGCCWWRSVYFWRPGTPGVTFLGLRCA